MRQRLAGPQERTYGVNDVVIELGLRRADQGERLRGEQRAPRPRRGEGERRLEQRRSQVQAGQDYIDVEDEAATALLHEQRMGIAGPVQEATSNGRRLMCVLQSSNAMRKVYTHVQCRRARPPLGQRRRVDK